MKTFLLVIKNNYLFGAAILISVFLYSFYMSSLSNDKLCINAKCFFIELAVNEAQWEKGLMGRNFLPAGKGMLFIFDQEKDYAMWMKNMSIPLDMIFIDKDLTVVSVKKNTQPCQDEYCPYVNTGKKILYVLEINAGAVEKAGIDEGQRVNLFLKNRS